MIEKKKKPSIRFKGFTDDLEQRKLGDMSDSFDYGLNAAATEFDGENKYIRITDIDDDSRRFLESDLTSPNTNLSNADNYKLKSGDILFARTGASVGKSYIYKEYDGLVYYAGFLIRARIKPEYDTEFVFQSTLTDGYDRYIRITSQRSGQPGVNAQEYAEFNLVVPKYEEQLKIGVFFKQLDNLITFHQCKHDKLINVKKAMMEKMFPKSGSNVPQIRFKGFTDEWEQCDIGDYYYFKNGLNKGKEFFGHGVPIVNFTDVFHNRGINASNLKGKVNLQPSEIANYRVQKGDIFFTRTSETIDEIGYPSVMIDEPKDTVFSGFVLRGRAIEEDPLTIKFKQYVFYTDEFRKEMIKKSSMTTRALTSGTAIKQMEIHFPKDKREQDKIGDYFQKLDNLITLYQRELEKLKNIKKACLQRMFL